MPIKGDRIYGTFHFHSTYSHDGRTTLAETVTRLREQQLSFCVMTEHFEDFDAKSLGRYLDEVRSLNDLGGFVLVPGVEIKLAGIDTIVFPVQSFAQCVEFIEAANSRASGLFAVIAHPSKYRPEQIASHLEAFHIDGIEIWNQQADSSYLPPREVLQFLTTCPTRHGYQYFFGCDLHDVRLSVANVLSLPRPPRLTVDSIVAEITSEGLEVLNRPTGTTYANREGHPDLDQWLRIQMGAKPSFNRRALRNVRRGLRGAYRMLPKRWQRSLNDFKNSVRNRV